MFPCTYKYKRCSFKNKRFFFFFGWGVFQYRWKEAGILQTCAPKNNDDWYWLHAAVYTGGKVLVLTNDEMRDHHFSMLSHRSFQRWKERHQVCSRSVLPYLRSSIPGMAFFLFVLVLSSLPAPDAAATIHNMRVYLCTI